MPIEINKELKHLGKLIENINKLVILGCLTPSPILKKSIVLGEQVIGFNTLQSSIWKKMQTEMVTIQERVSLSL